MMKNYTEINIKDYTREQWLDLRKKGIGGSEAGAIMGLNKWKTPLEIFLDKTEGSIPDEAGEAAYWGNQLEDMVAREFEIRTGKKVRRNNRMMFSTQYPFMLANVDREIVGEDAILECKTANAFLAKEWEADEIPASYIIQGQHYLSVTGRSKVYYAVLIGGQKFLWKELERDEDLIEMIIASEKNFWENHVLINTPPALDGSSAAERYLKERYDMAEDEKVIDLSSAYADRIRELQELKEKAKEYTDMANEIENNIKLEMQDAETAYTRNYMIYWKNVTSNRIDTKALKKDLPDIADKYTKPSTSRRFSIKELTEE